MSTKIYTWKSGITNILCQKCADHMFIEMLDKIIDDNMHLTPDELQNLDSVRELEFVDVDGVDCQFPCQPININKTTGQPECISTRFNSNHDD